MSKIASILKALRTSKRLTRKQMAEIIGIRERVVLNYEQGDSNPPYDILIKFADYFGVSTDYLLGRTDILNAENKVQNQAQGEMIVEIVRKQMDMLRSEDPATIDKRFYKVLTKLPEPFQVALCLIMSEMVSSDDDVAEDTEESAETILPRDLRKIEELPTINQKASAGSGYDFTEDNEYEMIPYDVTNLHRKDFKNCYVVEITGNSMMPKYCDGDCVLVNPDIRTDLYTVGLFKIDNERGYIKQLREDCLHSLNPQYKDIPFEDHEIIDCGKVLAIIQKA